jgi:hypothetical protein
MSAHTLDPVTASSDRVANVPVLAKPFEGQRMLALVELTLNTTPEAAGKSTTGLVPSGDKP